MKDIAINHITFAVNGTRIQERLAKLAKFGANETGGIDRNFGSDADIAARKYLIEILKNEIGANVQVDGAANIWAGRSGIADLPAIAVGSHHDTVLNGGRLDGAMGIILAMEILQVFREQRYPLRHPLFFVSFTAEEPNPFDLSTFGSRMATGKLAPDALTQVKDFVRGQSLAAALQRAGGNFDKLAAAQLGPHQLSAFIECHIEQGKRLEKQNRALAAVSHITGIYRENIRIVGEANHAGTTVMNDRHDALLAASEFCLAFEKAVRAIGRDDVVGTVGRLNIAPNAVNIIPGETALTMEIRTPAQNYVDEILTDLAPAAAKIETTRGVKIERTLLLDQAAVTLDQTVIQAMNQALTDCEQPLVSLTSMAGHDATHLADISRSGMLFVRSIDGKSHCPAEDSTAADIEQAGNVLLRTILLLDEELDSL